MVVGDTPYTNATTPTGAVAIQEAPQSDATSLIIVSIVFLTTAWLAVVLRFWTRAKVVQSLGWDDWFMGISLVFFTVYCLAEIETSSFVISVNFLPIGDLLKAINWLLVTELFYILTMLVLKVSLAIFFLRIMIKRWQRNVVYFAVTLSTLMNTGYFFFALFQCGAPVNSFLFFTKQVSDRCITKSQILGVAYAHAAVTTSTDSVFAFLPVIMLRNTNMTRRERLTVGLILVLGALGGVASAIRFKSISSLASSSFSFFADVNETAIWSTIEPGLGITAGSMATLRPLFRSFLRRARTLGKSGVGTANLSGTDMSATAAPTVGHSESELEATTFFESTTFFDDTMPKTKSFDVGMCASKDPWNSGDIWESIPRDPETTARQQAIELSGVKIMEAYDDVEVPVMKHPSSIFMLTTPPQAFRPSTSGSESPIIGYAI